MMSVAAATVDDTVAVKTPAASVVPVAGVKVTPVTVGDIDPGKPARVTVRLKGYQSVTKYVAFDKALDGVYSAVLYFRQQGLVVRGAPTLHPTVTSVTLGAPSRAVITDCFDTSKFASPMLG